MVEPNASRSRDCDKIIYDDSRGRLEFDVKRIIRRPLAFLSIMGPFLTSHHPFCNEFTEHTIHFGNRRWCMGCVLNSLSFAISFIVSFGLWFIQPLLYDRFWLFYGGLGGMVLYILIGLTGIDKRRKLRIGKKLILGFSFAMVCLSIIMAGGTIDYMLYEKIALIYVFYLAFVIFLIVKRTFEILKTCEKCEYRMRWSRCPGFKDIVCKNIEAGFIHALPAKSKTTKKEN